MGIKDLFRSIKKDYPQCIEQVKLLDLQGKKIAIDANLWMVKFWKIHAYKHIDSLKAEEFPDNEVILTETIKSFINLISTFLTYKITPIFVFDGGMQPEKKNTCEKRRELTAKSQSQLEVLMSKLNAEVIISEDDEKNIKKSRKQVSIPKEKEKSRVKEMLSYLGVPFIESKTDAEKLCCSLYLENKVDGVYSDDSDCLPYGCFDLYRKIENNEYNEKVFVHVSLKSLIELFGLTIDQFQDVCILCGSDYSKRPRGFTFNRSVSEIQSKQSIDNIISTNPKVSFDDLNYDVAKSIFRYCKSDKLINEEDLLCFDLSNVYCDDESEVNTKDMFYEIAMFKKARNEF